MFPHELAGSWLSVKRFLVVFLILPLLVVVASGSGDQNENVGVQRYVALIRMGFSDDALAERVRAFLEHELLMPVKLKTVGEGQPTSLADAGETAEEATDASVILAVVLADVAEATEELMYILQEARVGVVNTSTLELKNGDKEKGARRVERLAIRAVGKLVGAQPCPNPRCAFFEYRTPDQLDQIGRGMCPPTMMQVHRALKDMTSK